MPILTLITDIGEKDFLTGAIKGQMLRYQQDLNIVDITHTIPPFNYPQAAYICRNTINNFPPGTFHLILVNIFDENSNRFILVEHKGHFIGCADNGLVTMILEEEPQKKVALELDQLMQKSTLSFTNLFAKAIFFVFFFMWIRWTIPRFRYDQLMKLGWQILLPLSIINVLLTGGILTIFNK